MSRQLLALILFLSPIAVFSTHMRGGQIRVVSTDGLTCRIEMRLFTNTASEIMAGEGEFNFGDGTTEVTPTKSNTVLNEQPWLGLVVYEFEHTYAVPGRYVLSYVEPNLTLGILNMTNSVETRFYIESEMVISPARSYSSPDFPTDPIFVCPARRTYAFSTAAIDDSTSNDFYYKYSLDSMPKDIQGYKIPENLVIDPDNGIITWDTKFNGNYLAGMFWIVVRVNKYSELDEDQGYVLRAMQIIVEDSDSKIALTSSVTDSINRVVVVDGQQKKIKVILSDNNHVASLYFDVYYNRIIKENISITQYDSTAGDEKLRVAILSLKTTPDILADVPYPITLRGYASYRIDVTFLYVTKGIDWPKLPPPPVVVGLPKEDGLRIYPNPFRSEIFVDGTTSAEATFINSFGQVVIRSPLLQGQPINTTSLPVGIYFLKITDKDGVNSKFKVVRD